MAQSSVQRALAAARAELIPLLARHGFARLGRSAMFVRELGGVVQFVGFVGTRSGGSFSVVVDAWAPTLGDGAALPHAEVVNRQWLGGRLSPWRVDTGNWGWPIDSDAQLQADLRAITGHVERVALPWFDQLTDPVVVAEAAPRRGQAVDVVAGLRLQGGGQLVERLRSLGFRHEGPPLHHFVRERGPYVQVLLFDAVGCGVQVNVWVHVATRWSAVAAYGGKRQPHEPWLPVNGGRLGDEGLDAGNQAWLVQGPDAVPRTVPALLGAIEAHALPWFDAVTRREAYLLSLRADGLPLDRRARLLALLRQHLPADGAPPGAGPVPP